jgi:serine-threonine kinase receptor-associated protein
MASYEIGPGIHEGTIKSIIWNQDYNILTTASEDRKIRWWDLRSRHPFVEYTVDGAIGSCELNTLATTPNDPGVLSVAAGKSAYFFEGGNPGRLLKKVDFKYEIASVAVNSKTGRYVTGEAGDTWARVYDLDTDEELEVQKGHHGPIWSVSFSPDGKIYGTGSEDGTIKLWKACREPYGLWR